VKIEKSEKEEIFIPYEQIKSIVIRVVYEKDRENEMKLLTLAKQIKIKRAYKEHIYDLEETR